MRKFVTLLNCLIDCDDFSTFQSDAIQNLRTALLAPPLYRPNIQQALKAANFQFHRSCSFVNIIQECCDVGEGQMLLMFWHHSDSRVTISMSASSCSSLHMSSPAPPPTPNSVNNDRELRSVGQQTEISCKRITAAAFAAETEESRLIRARLADSLTASSPASSLLQPPHSMSILGSVCALLLSKQNSSAAPKPVPSYTGGTATPLDANICRICFGGESAERLVQPCSCRGTIAAVHRSCLERWLLQAATSYCELCRHHYVVTRSHKWSWIMSLCAWALSGRGRALAADAWRGAALGACSVLGTARALHACDVVLQAGARRGGGAALAANLFSSLLIGVIGALNGLLTTWMLLKIQEHQMSWQAWRDSTLHVHVTLDDETPPLSPHTSDVTIVGNADGTPSLHPMFGATADRATNIADPFMVSLPLVRETSPPPGS
ncbi:RING-variant domain-containing protein [Phthorimaea operculella]|nr:RING-variant domain-containing protein [Phthorimaea operculella]